jgi:hypothetical protein
VTLRVAIGRPSESGRYAAVSPRQSHSVPPSQTMIWMDAASPPSCGLGGVRGRQRSAISPSAWDGRLRQAAQAWPGLGVRSELDTCGRIRRAAESRRTAAARSGIFGWTIRDPSCLPLDGRRNSRIRGRLSAVKPCACSAANCVRLRRRDVDAFGRFVRSAFATCVWRTLAGCDPMARKRPAKRTKARAPSERSSASTATSRRGSLVGLACPFQDSHCSEWSKGGPR